MKNVFGAGAVIALVLCVGVFAFLFATNTPGRALQEGLETVKIAHVSGQFSTNFPLFVGEKTGIFAKNGLNVVGEEMDARIAVPALLNGSVDYIPFSREGASAALKGADIKFVSMITENQFLYLIGRGDRPADIESISVSHMHGSTHYFSLLAMERNKFDAKLVDAGNSVPATRSMVISGVTDAAILGYLAPIDFAAEGLQILDDFNTESFVLGLNTSGKAIRERPEQVRRVTLAFKEVARYIKENPEATKELLYEYYGYSERTEAQNAKVERALADASRFFSPTGAPSEDQQRLLIQIAKVSEMRTLEEIRAVEVTDDDLRAVFDLRFVE
jgi:ABC-type nitrate/sulfonate/bicarbonate transport system substrate-binding protein